MEGVPDQYLWGESTYPTAAKHPRIMTSYSSIDPTGKVCLEMIVK